MGLEKERTLKFHWQNPKFDGLPWPAGKPVSNVSKSKKPRRCVKVPRSLEDAKNETAKLRAGSPGFRWSFSYCRICQGFHVIRH